MKRGVFVGGIIILIAVGVFFVMKDDKPNSQKSKSAYTGTYVAMGDSVAAGIGLPTGRDSSACDRTNESYPVHVARAMNYRLVDLACSGATLTDGIVGAQTVNELAVHSQLNELFTEKPAIISLSIGANDTGWLSLLTRCYQAACGGTNDQATYQEGLSTMQVRLTEVLHRIHEHYQEVPQVVVLGYYKVFSDTDVSCSDVSGIDATERAFGRAIQAQLNETLRNAVRDSGVGRYVAADFTGHELCSSDPWVQGLTEKAPYHPTVAGQAALAAAVKTTITKDHK